MAACHGPECVGFNRPRGRVLRFERLEDRALLSLTHLYTFNDGTVNDWVGNAHGTLENGATVVAGRLALANVGVLSGQSSAVQYAKLPANVLGSGDATIEAWYTAANSANWARVFDIGNQSGGAGDSYLSFTLQSGTYDSRAILRPSGAAERIASGPTTDDGLQHMTALVIDSSAGLLRLYLDGTAVATTPLSGASVASVNDALAYVGRSLFNVDPGFTGSVNELRIFDDAVPAGEISAHAALGPSTASKSPLTRQMEYLNRGVVAMRTGSSSAYIGWRLLGTEPNDIAFNLYRSAGGGAPAKLTPAPLTQTTDFVDSSATGLNLNVSNSYFVRPVIGGVEQGASESYTLTAAAPVRQYINVPLSVPAGGTVVVPAGTLAPPSGTLNYTYNANDASVGDLDGDGQYEIVLKWDASNSQDNSIEGLTGNTLLDAYRLDGTHLWRIDLGRNIRSGAHYSPFLVYDFDGDGRAEVVVKTSDGAVDGLGNVIGNANADYRDGYTGSGDSRWGRVYTGAEYLSIFSGLTGSVIDSIPFQPARGSVASWGDSYGNRSERFQGTVAYLDGVHPSIVFNRGYAGPQSGFSARNEVATFDFRDQKLSLRWLFQAATNGANPGYVGQTAHSITLGDVDNDGKDEIITGASALNDDGKLLYNTGLGHGDALHLSDMDPSRPGLEIFMPHESPNSYGSAGGEFRNARTGALIFGIPANNDVGRGNAFDIDPNYPGYEMWATTDDPAGGTRMIYSAQGQPIYPTASNMFYNFGVWWDADPLRELEDGTTISDWNYTTHGRVNYDLDPATSGTQTAPNASSNNSTKSTPGLVADILGDWREEVIWRRSDNTALEIFTTIIPAASRMYTLMHDPQYREAIAWQNSGYNQPPHPSFFVGAGMATPPTPQIYLAPQLAGDYNRDKQVDAADYVLWRKTLGSLSDVRADGKHDGIVNSADWQVWRANFGANGFAASATSDNIDVASAVMSINSLIASVSHGVCVSTLSKELFLKSPAFPRTATARSVSENVDLALALLGMNQCRPALSDSILSRTTSHNAEGDPKPLTLSFMWNCNAIGSGVAQNLKAAFRRASTYFEQ